MSRNFKYHYRTIYTSLHRNLHRNFKLLCQKILCQKASFSEFRFKHWIIPLMGVTLYAACSDVKFDHKPSETCNEFNGAFGEGTCTVNTQGVNEYNYSIRVGPVGIIVVIDPSESMVPEQEKMVSNFHNLVNNVSHLDWRMSVTTTDVANERGKFLQFPNGKDMISVNTSHAKEEFRGMIKQIQDIQEARRSACRKSSNYKKCPSGDERAIYAVNLALDRGHAELFGHGHLVIIILSDENERSNGGKYTGDPLEEYDLPETLVSKVKHQLGPRQTISVHPIVIRSLRKNADGKAVFRPDVSCFNKQNKQEVSHYGTMYEELAFPDNELKALGGIVEGHTGSICAADYGAELGAMASKIVTNSQIEKLPCNPENPEDLQVTFSPEPESLVELTVDENNFLRMNPAVPAGTIVSVKVRCSITQ